MPLPASPEFCRNLREVLAALRSEGSLMLARPPELPSNLQQTSTPDPFHSDDLSPIGGDLPAIARVVRKSIELALEPVHKRVKLIRAGEETLLNSVRPLQAWVVIVQRARRPEVYLKGLFVQNGVVVLLSLHQ